MREARLGPSTTQPQVGAGAKTTTTPTASTARDLRSRLAALPVRKVGDPLLREDFEARPASGKFLTHTPQNGSADESPAHDRGPAMRRQRESRQETMQIWSPIAARAKGVTKPPAARTLPTAASLRAASDNAVTTLHVVKPSLPTAANPFALDNPFAPFPPPVSPAGWPSKAPAWPSSAPEALDEDEAETIELLSTDALPPEELTPIANASRTTWVDDEHRKFPRPSDVIVTLLTKVRAQGLAFAESAQRRYAQLRSDLMLVALRAHGVVVHKTRGRVGAILLATSPVLLLSAIAAIWLTHRAPAAKQAQLLLPAAEVVPPSDAEVAQMLRERTGFTVSTEPAGARIYVDGFATGRVTPERVTGFAAGIHSIELKQTGYYDVNLAAVLEEGSTLVMPPVVLSPLPTDHEQPAEQ